jgi:transposase InsO family protein
MRYRFIHTHAREFRVTTMCRVLLVLKAGYYAWPRRVPSARTIATTTLTAQIRVVHTRSRATYGSPRIHAELRADGQAVSVNRVARVMRRAGIAVQRRRRFRVTTQSQHAHPIAANVLDRQFAVATVPAMNRTWVTDITYIPTHAGWLYLAVVLDLASRRIVGWAMLPRSTGR